MAIDPAAISGQAAHDDQTRALDRAGEAGRQRKRYIKPSDMPMTMSRTKFVAVKSISTCEIRFIYASGCCLK